MAAVKPLLGVTLVLLITSLITIRVITTSIPIRLSCERVQLLD